MATVETALVSILKADAGLTAQLSGRLYPIAVPEGGSLPAVVYQRYTGIRTYGLEGVNAFKTANVQFTVWAETYAEAVTIANLLIAATDATGDVGGITIDHIEVTDDGDIPSLAAEAESLTRYGRYIDLKVFFTD